MSLRHRTGATAQRLFITIIIIIINTKVISKYVFCQLCKIRLGQPGSIPALMLPSGVMAVRHRKDATAERFTVQRPLLMTVYRAVT
ncbi:hypothetical protein CSKR_101605 [Clonorchis sinensis]|uniref:Uncharacterized protein n=1 Tax=Clonorchis sinensis TaxID=79923 RepID=A0A419Q6K3_CLOSI|nr:hypothetical protein CSKR_101605 [Clonorchis sinensis]